MLPTTSEEFYVGVPEDVKVGDAVKVDWHEDEIIPWYSTFPSPPHVSMRTGIVVMHNDELALKWMDN